MNLIDFRRIRSVYFLGGGFYVELSCGHVSEIEREDLPIAMFKRFELERPTMLACYLCTTQIDV